MVETVLVDPSEEYLDPATREGLHAGILQAGLQGFLLVVVFVLSVFVGALDPATVLAIPGPVATVGGLAGLVVGVGSIARLHYREPPAWVRRVGWRRVSNVLFVLGFTALLVTVQASAFLGGVGYVLGRLGAHLLIYAVG